MSHADPGHEHVPAPVPHVLPMPLYLGIFATLIGLTVLTVAVAQIDLGPFTLPIAMLVATVKAALVALVFMHLWFDSKLNAVVFVATLLFLAIFIVLTMFDVLTRAEIDPIRRNFLPRDEIVQKYYEENPEARPLRPKLQNPLELGDRLIDVEAYDRPPAVPRPPHVPPPANPGGDQAYGKQRVYE